jgi:hypothetical protein
MTALMLAAVMTLSPVGSQPSFSESGGCTNYSWSRPPDHINVLRAHRKGSPVPKRVERWDMDRYVAAVAASGAWPNRLRESIRVGVLAISQYAWWEAVHTCRMWHGHTYQISDSQMYLRPAMRPDSHLPARTLAAVRYMLGTHVQKHGRNIRTGWSGGTCRDGFHLCEDSVRAKAERGWSWQRIVRYFLSPDLRIVRP